jgi:hypothetical protein
MGRRGGLLLVVGILVFAFGLRVWGLGFGLPYAYHPDEPTYVSQALNLGAGIIGRQPNPTGLSHILFGEYAGYYLAGRLTGLFSSAAAFEQAYRANPSIFLLLGRLTSALLGTLTVLVVYGLGTRLNRRTVGWLAALLLAIAFLHVRDSHYGVPDIATTFFISLAVLLCIVASQKHSNRYLGLAAAATGLAVATKWSVWPIGFPLLIAFGVQLWWRSHHRLAPVSRQILFGLAIAFCFLAGFALGGFELFIKPATYIEYALREARAGEAGGFGLWQIDTVSGWEFYLKTLLYGLDAILLCLGIVGLVRRAFLAATRREVASVLLIAFPMIYFIVMGSTQHYFARYALPLIPFITVGAAEIVIVIYDWLVAKKNRSLARGITGLLVVAALIMPLLKSIQHDILLTKTDTRTIAKDWIEANLPAGAKIAADWPIHTPPLATAEQAVPDTATVYDVQYIGGAGLSDHDLNWYRQQGYHYLIASSFIDDIPLVFPKQDAERKAFYDSLPQQLELVKEVTANSGSEPPYLFDEIYGPAISLWQRERPGPTLKIYQVTAR